MDLKALIQVNQENTNIVFVIAAECLGSAL